MTSVDVDVKSLVTDEMRACIGNTSAICYLPEEISASDVRRYIEATGDKNPLWTDAAFARSVGYQGPRVPPIFILQLYRRAESWEMGESDDWSGLVLPPNFTSTRNAGQEVEWLAPVYVGDTLEFQDKLVDVFAARATAVPSSSVSASAKCVIKMAFRSCG